MREGETTNKRKFVILEVPDADAEWESVPGKPFGALVVAKDERPDKELFGKLAKRLIETGCAWATLHAGKNTHRLHDIFDKAIVDYELNHNPDAEMMTSGEDEDSLEESMRDAVWQDYPSYEDPCDGLLVMVVGEQVSTIAEQLEALAQSVGSE